MEGWECYFVIIDRQRESVNLPQTIYEYSLYYEVFCVGFLIAGDLTFSRSGDRMRSKITISSYIYQCNYSEDTVKQPRSNCQVTREIENESIFINAFLIDFESFL